MPPRGGNSRGARAAQAAAQETAAEQAARDIQGVAKKLEDELGLATDRETRSTVSFPPPLCFA